MKITNSRTLKDHIKIVFIKVIPQLDWNTGADFHSQTLERHINKTLIFISDFIIIIAIYSMDRKTLI